MDNAEAKEVLIEMANSLQIIPSSRQGEAFTKVLNLLDIPERNTIEESYKATHYKICDKFVELCKENKHEQASELLNAHETINKYCGNIFDFDKKE